MDVNDKKKTKHRQKETVLLMPEIFECREGLPMRARL
jgi:hypothetical protein